MKKFCKQVLLIFTTSVFISSPVLASPMIPTCISHDESNIVCIDDNLYTYEEMEADIAELSDTYPDMLSFSIAGKSVDNRNVYAIILGNPDAKYSVFVEAGTHGREYMNCMLVMAQIEDYLIRLDEYYRNNLTFGDILDNCNIVIMPMVNPDGVAISQRGLEAIENEELRAKLETMPGAGNPKKWKSNANGVDLNRQYPSCWGKVVNADTPTSGGSNNPYNGVAPITEPEVAAVVNTVNSIGHLVAAISFHSSEGAVYYDMGEETSEEITNKCKELAIHVGNLTGYRVGELDNKPSVARGLLYNWLIIEKEVRTVLVETCRKPSPQPFTEWDSLWASCWEVPLFAAMTYAPRQEE